jgi:hypothetical protein
MVSNSDYLDPDGFNGDIRAEEPDCICGHHSHDHYSDPSGMAPSRCWHADTYDSLDYPATGACNCRDYNPVPA